VRRIQFHILRLKLLISWVSSHFITDIYKTTPRTKHALVKVVLDYLLAGECCWGRGLERMVPGEGVLDQVLLLPRPL